MSEEKWKLEKDLCRCCLNEGTFKNLAEPFLYQGEEEIYSEMLLESLDVNIIPVSGPLCTSTYTICEECILRVRDACHFKRLVLSNEKRFHDLYSRNIIQLTSSDLGVKKEAPDSDNEPIEDEVKMEALDDDDNFRLNYDDEVNDDGDNKSDINLDLQAAKKAKAKKPKAKEKAKPRKRAARPAPRKAKAEAGAEEPKEKKDLKVAVPPDANFTLADDGARYACKICGGTYKTIAGVKNHIYQSHKPTFRCEVCDKPFSNQGLLTKHQYTHPSVKTDNIPKQNFCKICKKYERYIVTHLKKHGIFRCIKCLLEFSSKGELTSHKILIHDGTRHVRQPKIFTCDHCGEVIRGPRRSMVRHLRNHGFFKCETCPRIFTNAKELSAHYKRRHPVPKVTCGICGYKARRSALAYHQKSVHMMERNVPCPQCDAKFFSVGSLKAHMVRHNPVKKYKCRFCGKMFPRSETWRRHERIHTGDKRKVCLICDARFVQKASLSYHLKKYHPEAV